MQARRFLVSAPLALAAAVIACGPDAPTAPDAALATATEVATAKPGEPGAASDRMFFKAKLEPLGGTRARGMVMLEIVGGHLTARLHATGLVPGQHIPQHIHVNPGCAVGGAVLVNLDAGLNVAGEAPPTGAAYPVANPGGVVKYEASRPLTELLAAANTYAGANLANVDELIAWLDLENRNAHMHVPFGPPFPAVTCGPVDRTN